VTSTTPKSPIYPTQANSTTPVAPTGSIPSATTTYPATYTGAAVKVAGGAVAGAAGILAAFFL
jgi:hypothetical protein